MSKISTKHATSLTYLYQPNNILVRILKLFIEKYFEIVQWVKDACSLKDVPEIIINL